MQELSRYALNYADFDKMEKNLHIAVAKLERYWPVAMQTIILSIQNSELMRSIRALGPMQGWHGFFFEGCQNVKRLSCVICMYADKFGDLVRSIHGTKNPEQEVKSM